MRKSVLFSLHIGQTLLEYRVAQKQNATSLACFFLYQLKLCLLCKFCFLSWVSRLWPATIPIFFAFGPWLNVIEDPWCTRSILSWRLLFLKYSHKQLNIFCTMTIKSVFSIPKSKLTHHVLNHKNLHFQNRKYIIYG